MVKSKDFAQRLRTLIGAFVVMLVAAVSLVAMPAGAWADPYLGYESKPLGQDGDEIYPREDGRISPGFRWVEATDTEPAYYEVYDPLNEAGWDGGTAHESAAGWWYFAYYSRTYDFKGYLIKLHSNIDYSGFDYGRDPNAGRTQLAVGSEDKPFAGTFDGQNYTLSGLNNEREGLEIVHDCGFFGVTDGAVIRDFNLTDTYIGASYRGGVLVGRATNTLIEDVVLTNCTSSVIPGNNVLNLITNAGFSGGILAGEINNSTIYNCEVKGGRAVCNATQGVAALGGQPLYLGAMVGYATDSVIEYSRVTAFLDEEGRIKGDTGGAGRTEVSMKYDTAIGAVGGSELYTGGIVGGIMSTKGGSCPSRVADCFSTASIDSYAAIYVSVGAGAAGYVGGITGRVGSSASGSTGNVYFQRDSFDGKLNSYQYNAIAVIPIIQHDVLLAGIIGRGANEIDRAACVQECYFNDATIGELDDGNKVTSMQGNTLYSNCWDDGTNFGPRGDRYAQRTFFEGRGYDFTGGIERDDIQYPWYGNAQITPSFAHEGGEHVNKWVMDYINGMPIHGWSIKATLDFPEAGTVQIGSTGLDLESNNPEAATSDPYTFAVQGFLATDTDGVDITYTEAENPAKGDTTNDGWRVEGWYRHHGVDVNTVPADHGEFTEAGLTLNGPVIADGNAFGNKGATAIKPANGVPGQEDDYVDDDLFLVNLEANVLLHDINGNIINRETGTNQEGSTENDWYAYEDAFTLLSTLGDDADKPSSESAMLIGWTTEPVENNGAFTGYEGITSTELTQLKLNGTFFEVGSTFTVTAPANLYPVYADYLTNAHVIYEGWQRVGANQTPVQDTRPEFGQAVVRTDEASGDIYVAVIPEEGGKLTQGAVRFLGWYENVGDDTNENWVRVDTGEQLEQDEDGTYKETLKAGQEYFTFNLTDAKIDLTTPHTYMARFEYRVDYYQSAADDDVMSQIWYVYGQPFHAISSVDGGNGSLYENDFMGWWTNRNCSETPSYDAASGSISHQQVENGGWKIQYPMSYHAHWKNNNPGSANMSITATVDFPGSGDVVVESRGGGIYDLEVTSHEGYSFGAWTLDRADKQTPDHYLAYVGKDVTVENGTYTWNPATFGVKNYWAEAVMLADVTFEVPGVSDMTVQRRYRQNIFVDEPVETSVYLHYSGKDVYKIRTAGTGRADSEDVNPRSYEVDFEARTHAPEGYVFLGWVEASAVDAGVMTPGEWDYIFADGGNDQDGTVKHIERVVPYLVNEDARCVRATTLKAVYVPITITATTNVHEAGAPDGYDMPEIPNVTSVLDADSVYQSTNLTFTPADYSETQEGVFDGGDGTVSLQYDRKGNAKVTVKAQSEKPYADGSDEAYKLQNVTLTVDDGEPQVLIPDVDTNDDPITNQFTVDVQLGHEYVFTANYQPLPVEVTYHFNDDSAGDVPETETHLVSVGDVVPTPGYAPTFEKDGFFIGWTEATGVVDYDETNPPVLVVPGSDRVEHEMDLWPVYRSGKVTVNSNIDVSSSANDWRGGTVEDDALLVWAQTSVELNGATYVFKGWTTSYAAGSTDIDENMTSPTFSVTGDDRFVETTYTAIYEESYLIRYHGVDGSVINEVPLTPDEAQTRTFVTMQTVIPDPEHPDETQEVEAMIDVAAFNAINAQLDENASAQDAAHREQFVEWQLVSGSTVTSWSDYKDETVASLCGTGKVLDIYPVTVSMNALDSTNANFTQGLIWTVSHDENGALKIAVQLKGAYAQDTLTVHVEERAYTAENTFTEVDLENIPVSLLGPGGSGGLTLGEKATDGKGDAVFTFRGWLTITKSTADSGAAGKVFPFTVTNTTTNETHVVNIEMPDAANKDGIYSATVKLALPYGTYAVAEDAGWAWRYEATTKAWTVDQDWEDADANGVVEVKIQYDGVENVGDGLQFRPSRVETTNERTNNKWSDGSDYKHNVFNETTEGGN